MGGILVYACVSCMCTHGNQFKGVAKKQVKFNS